MTVVVKLFAAVKERIGTGEIRLSIEEAQPLQEVMRLLEREYPLLRGMTDKGRLLVAVNQEMATDETIIRAGDEIALLPPFSGGRQEELKRPVGDSGEKSVKTLVRIQQEDFSVEEEIRHIRSRSTRIGGVVTFLGTARDLSQGHAVKTLTFDCYPTMAEKKLREIREHALKNFDIIEVSLIHRVGEIPIGGNIVLIVVGAEHRDAAFAACRWCIEELKRSVPLWKKETTPEGEVWVEWHP